MINQGNDCTFAMSALDNTFANTDIKLGDVCPVTCGTCRKKSLIFIVFFFFNKNRETIFKNIFIYIIGRLHGIFAQVLKTFHKKIYPFHGTFIKTLAVTN